PLAAVEVGQLLEKADPKDALSSYMSAFASDHEDASPLAAAALGEWFEELGLEDARKFYVAAINSRHPKVAPKAALRLGYLVQESEPGEAIQALLIAEGLGDCDTAAAAALAGAHLFGAVGPRVALG